jgi:ferredoxin-nitrite reductase
MQLGGITGHKDFARDTGLLLEPEQCLPVAVAALRVFIDHGDRTDRKRARLKYVLDQWGIEKYVEEMKRHLSFTPMRVALEECEMPEPSRRLAHMGFHAQKQDEMYYCGVVVPVGRLTVTQMRGLAAIAERHGSGTIRLTVWQNLLISDIPQEKIALVKSELRGLDLDWAPSAIRSALVACTGNTGCKFSATHTKKHAMDIARRVDSTVAGLDQPVNVHLTGCPHSCAQHCISEIGMLGTKIAVGEQMVEGYHVYVGGGCGADQGLGREVARDVPAEDAGPLVERMVRAYLEHRTGAAESFGSFSRRYSIEQLKDLFDARLETAGAAAR